jgi:DNA-binding CsgD family transcriptional regulator
VIVALALLAGFGTLFAHLTGKQAFLPTMDDGRVQVNLFADPGGSLEEMDRTVRRLEDLAVAIDREFTKWDLTDAERNVALMLLQGLSHREIATARGTNEGTVRQQALAIYRKAGLTGRSSLAAFFLEGLALPDRAASRSS